MHTDGEGNSHDSRQRLGHNGDREGDGEDKHFQQRLAAPQAQRNDHHHNDHGGLSERPPNLIEIQLQRSLAGFYRLQHCRDLAELGVHGGGDHHRAPPAIGRRGARVSHILSVAQREFAGSERCRLFFDRNRFTGKRRLIYL